MQRVEPNETWNVKENSVSTALGVNAVPEAIRSVTTLAEPSYVDLFTLTTKRATDWSAEEWARAVLEQAPVARHNARRLWRLLGLRLGPRNSPDHVQGWNVAGRGDGWVRVETTSWYMTGQAICFVTEGRVSISLALRYDHPFARVVWSVVAGPHQRAVPVMLRQAARVLEPAQAPGVASSP